MVTSCSYPSAYTQRLDTANEELAAANNHVADLYRQSVEQRIICIGATTCLEKCVAELEHHRATFEQGKGCAGADSGPEQPQKSSEDQEQDEGTGEERANEEEEDKITGEDQEDGDTEEEILSDGEAELEVHMIKEQLQFMTSSLDCMEGKGPEGETVDPVARKALRDCMRECTMHGVRLMEAQKRMLQLVREAEKATGRLTEADDVLMRVKKTGQRGSLI